MKKVLSVSIVTIFCITVLLSFKVQLNEDSKSDFIVVKIIEPYAGAIATPGIVISYGNGKHEIVSLKKNKLDNAGQNADTLNVYLNKFKKEGFKLKISTGGDYFSTLIFERE